MLRVSIHPGNPGEAGKIREFEMTGKHTGNTREIVEHTGKCAMSETRIFFQDVRI